MKAILFVVLVALAVNAHDNTCCSNPGGDAVHEADVCSNRPFTDTRYVGQTCNVDVSRSGIPCATREAIMQQALQVAVDLNHGLACPRSPFAAIIGIHHGPNVSDFERLCTGVNNASVLGFTAHGEMEALRACAQVIKNSPKYGPNYFRNTTFWQTISLYTTGESCPMCMSAARFHHLGEMIYGTSIKQLITQGYVNQITLYNGDIQQHSNECNYGGDGTAQQTRLVVDVLSSQTNVFFNWQNNPAPHGNCPTGCVRQTATPFGCVPGTKRGVF